VFKGVYTVLVTPFTAEGRVDVEGVKKNVEWQVSQGIHGVAAIGSTGEFAGLEDDEKEQVAQSVIDAVNGRVPVVVGATAESTEKTIRYAKAAKRLGADGILVLPSYYCNPNQDEIFTHFARLADAVDIPVIIYNNPSTTGVDIKADTAARMFNHNPNLSTIKECTGDIKRITEIRLLTGDKMTIFCGWEDMAYESFVMGATGWICVIGNVAPSLSVKLFDLVQAGDLGGAWEIYKKLLPMLRALEYWGKAPQMLKYCLGKMGLAGGEARSPRLPLSDSEKGILDGFMKDMGVA
jgi:4-hydroxy-tetrahydrodipicolinate synthase